MQNHDELSDKTESPRQRLSPSARRDMIVEAAVELFSETGFEGSTRDIARVAGVTQPLLYRYFPNKESLIEAVYARVFLTSWNAEWDKILTDRSRSVQSRFQQFYESYTEVIFQPVWLRLWHFATLRDVEVYNWYKEVVQEQILKPLVRERRIELQRSQKFHVSASELDAPWLLHGGLLNYGLRRQVEDTEENADARSQMIRQTLEMFLLISAATPAND
jgi:AcrR family transcriptional regulator